MKNILYQSQWGWLTSGIALALMFLLAVFLVKPIGVSTQFVIMDGIIWNGLSGQVVIEDSAAKSGYSSPNAYLNKSGGKYAGSVADPVNYSFVFVLSMVVGGFIARRMQKENNASEDMVAPPVWRKRFGHSGIKRYFYAFIGGILVLFGARMAGGCTSGHMMSGMMQTALSGYLFALGTFAVAIPVAVFFYRRRG